MEAGGGAKRMDAIKLAKGSRWEELRRLVDAEPLTAQQTDSYGMLPLHWACTEPHSISEGVLMALLKAFPQGARVVNTAEMVPLQIAIKAQGKIEWLQALLASYPDAVLKKTPTGENAVELARKANLPPRSVRLLEEMFHHVCQKAGYMVDHVYEEAAGSAIGSEMSSGGHRGSLDGSSRMPEKISVSGLRPVNGNESLQQYAADANAHANANAHTNAVAPRRPTHSNHKSRAYSDNDFASTGDPQAALRATDPSALRGISTSSNGSTNSMSMSTGLTKPLPYQVSTKLSSRTVVSLPPRWTNAPNCHICSQKFFGAFRKRHHCRNCGQSICGDHSARERMKLPHYGLTDRYRVCTVCHEALRNAGREMLQPSQGRVTAMRRSDEAAPRLSGPSMSNGGSKLERHVSEPVGLKMNAEYDGIHDQVANLQKQVSQLMEEKQLAESQLRAQAELLGSSGYSAGTARVSSNDSRGSSRGSGGAAPVIPPPPPPQLTILPSRASYTQYDASGRRSLTGMSRSSLSHEQDRDVDVDVDIDIDRPSSVASRNSTVPEPPTSANSVKEGDAVTQLQDGLGAMSFNSSYSEFDDRQAYTFDDVDDQDRVTAHATVLPSTVMEGYDEAAIQQMQEEEEEDAGSSTLPEVEVLVNLGMSMLSKGSCSGAVQAFARAVEICPDNGVLYSYLAKAHYADENLDDAVEALEMSLELEPSAANSTLLGKILFEKGDHEKAIQAYQKSLEYQHP